MTAKTTSARPLRAWIGLAFFAVVATVGLGAGLWVPADPNQQLDPAAARLRPPGTTLELLRLDDGRTYLADAVERAEGELRMSRLGRVQSVPAERVVAHEERTFLLGTDRLGRDVLARWAHGARVSLLVGLLAVGLAMTLGVAVGAVAALGPRLVDGVLMRAVDGLLAFPWFFLLLALAAFVPPSVGMLILILGATGWMGVSRLARSEIAGLAEREFVHAARGLGMGEVHIFFRHVLPNALTPLAVAATFRIGAMILTEATLSYLGVGVPAPDASWGNMIADSRSVLTEAWWVAGSAALGLVLTVASVTFVADGLRDLLDPRHGATSS